MDRRRTTRRRTSGRGYRCSRSAVRSRQMVQATPRAEALTDLGLRFRFRGSPRCDMRGPTQVRQEQTDKERRENARNQTKKARCLVHLSDLLLESTSIRCTNHATGEVTRLNSLNFPILRDLGYFWQCESLVLKKHSFCLNPLWNNDMPVDYLCSKALGNPLPSYWEGPRHVQSFA